MSDGQRSGITLSREAVVYEWRGGTSARSTREIAEGLQIEFVKLAWRGSLFPLEWLRPRTPPHISEKLLGRRAKLRPS